LNQDRFTQRRNDATKGKSELMLKGKIRCRFMLGFQRGVVASLRETSFVFSGSRN